MKKPGWGKRHENGVMNKLEATYAEILEGRRVRGEIVWYRFESVTLRLTDRDQLTRYTPDFLVQLASGELEAHEVKGGLFPEHNRLKLKLAADQYPLRFILAQYKNKATGWKIGAV